MPCNSDYLERDHYEAQSRLACECLDYALGALGKPVPAWITAAAGNYYGNPAKLNEATVMLCTLCRGMTAALQTVIIYDGRSPQARKLADWWEAHQKADAAREARELQAKTQEAHRQSALSKLTDEERRALGIAAVQP
jgi:hypothetical protein